MYYTNAAGGNDYCNYIEIPRGETLGALKAKVIRLLDIDADHNVVFKDAFGQPVRGYSIYPLSGEVDVYSVENVDNAIRTLVGDHREVCPEHIEMHVRDNAASSKADEGEIVGLSIYNLTCHEVRVSMKVRSNGQNGYFGTTRQLKKVLKPRTADGAPNGCYDIRAMEGHGYTVTM